MTKSKKQRILKKLNRLKSRLIEAGVKDEDYQFLVKRINGWRNDIYRLNGDDLEYYWDVLQTDFNDIVAKYIYGEKMSWEDDYE